VPTHRLQKKKQSKKANGSEILVLDPNVYDDRSRENRQQENPETHSRERILVLPPPSDPMAVARIFIERCRHDGALTLLH
jgi:hypothetical protein